VKAAAHCAAILALAWAVCAQAEEALYRLPYLDGSAYTISQAPGGMIRTHTTRDSRYAIDFTMPEGTPVVAARDGVVVAVEWRHVRGGNRGELRYRSNFVRVRHADGSFAIYAHLVHAGVSVEEGEGVWAGRLLGYSGSTGYVSAPHLHFGVTLPDESQGVEVSVPVIFYNGNPPVEFTPRAGLAVRASYAVPVEPMAWPGKRVPARSVLQDHWRPAPPAPPTAEMIAQGWIRIWAMLVAAVAGFAWFFRFSNS
jgi:murein DD-endopeptidase MepM/ murein hydrolase activator NlpD